MIIQVKTHKLYIIKKRSNNKVSFVEFIFNSQCRLKMQRFLKNRQNSAVLYSCLDVAVGDEKLCTDGKAWKLPAECEVLSQSVSKFDVVSRLDILVLHHLLPPSPAVVCVC